MLAPLFLALTVSAAAAPGDPAGAGAIYSGRDRHIHVTIPRIDATVSVDGVLDEDVWRQAARLVDFSEYSPLDGRPADESAEVYVWYSPTAIYFGMRAHMPAGTVHATLANRDHIDADDGFDIFLSPFNDGRQALVFGVNPLGVQGDGILVETGKKSGAAFSALESGREQTDLTPDYVYTSKGRLTDEGYEVEVEIPFKTLRFPSAPVQSWGINVVQRVQATGHEHSWVPASRANNSFLGQSGTLDGLEGMRRGLVLDLNPVVTAKSDGAPEDTRWVYNTAQPEFGMNVRWGITPNLTLSGTYNPDFSQVEADASQFVYDPRAALYFPEKRPFFLEGAELFAAPNDLIYTRRIVSPVAASKVTGTVGGTNVAGLSAVDDVTSSASGLDHPIFNIFRLQRNLGGDGTKLGLVYTDRIEGSNYNRVAAADARLTFGSIYTLQFQGGASITRLNDTTKSAPIWQAIFSRDGRHFGSRYEVTGIHEDFRADSGFISRGGIIHANATNRVSLFGAADAFIQSWSTAVALDGIWQYRVVTTGDPLLEKKLHFYNTVKLKGGWTAGGSLLLESFAFDTQLYADYALRAPGGGLLPFTGTPHLQNRDYVLSLSTPRFSRFTASTSWVWGRDENFFEWSSADIAFVDYALDWRPSERLRVSPEFRVQWYDRRTDGTRVGQRNIPRLKAEYQLTRSIFFRFVGQYDTRKQDTLRDDGRTELPILIRDSTTGIYAPASAYATNNLRVDWLFSYQPRPGTVIFVGYGSTLEAQDALRSNQLQRTNDGFFVKISYLFRM